MQGFNMGRYVPPDQEGLVTSGNALHKKHPLGNRASKLASQGILIVRFEMPFAVWCTTCRPEPTIIGQGVRFNAEKKKIGYYHSSPIFSFRIKHTACGGYIEIRTDPQHTRYVVVSGGKQRDTGDTKEDDSLVKVGGAGDFGIPTAEERADMRESAFGKLEKTIADREKLEDARQRIGELQDAAARQWDDPYALNQRLRKAFRVGRHEREKEAARTEDLRDRMSLGIELLPGTEEDSRRAALIDFGKRIDDVNEPVDDGNNTSVPSSEVAARMDKVLARPLFDDPKPLPNSSSTPPKTSDSKPRHEGRDHHSSSSKKARPSKSLLKSEIAASRVRSNLISEISGNTRAAKDPFLDFDFRSSRDKNHAAGSPLLGLINKKRKRMEADAPSPTPPQQEGVGSGTCTITGGENTSPALSPVPASTQGTHDEGNKAEKEKQPASGGNLVPAAVSALVSYDSDSE